MIPSHSGEGSSSSARRGGSSTLGDVMRAPSTNAPDVVVLEELPEEPSRKETLDPKEDLWLSTADGRYNSPIIPVRVGTWPSQEVFHVHKNILLRVKWFEKALCGGFKESEDQFIDLPEEDPAIFHFVVAYLYEGRYIPTKPLSTVLVPDPDKGKGREGSSDNADSESDSSTASFVSDSSARSRRRRERRRRREERHFERLRQKHPGAHRPQCGCPQCLNAQGAPCWSCSAPRVPPPLAPPMPPPGVVVIPAAGRSREYQRRRRAGGWAVRAVSPPPPLSPDPNGGGRIQGEDMRTWLIAYELNMDVYICAERFCMEDFKEKVARVTIDMLESAGSDAAQIEVLHLCKKLYAGVPEDDPLLKMVFARLGFLQTTLWRKDGQETNEFLVSNPEIGALILKETASRREEDFNGRLLPSMERASYFPAFDSAQYRPAPQNHRVARYY